MICYEKVTKRSSRSS